MAAPRTTSAAPHAFMSSLDFSQAAAVEAWWDAIYQATFPDLLQIVRNRADNVGQRAGFDAMLVLTSGRSLLLDEKTRKLDYGDIALEWKHQWNDQRIPTPGWIEKDLAVDFVAYGCLSTGRVCLLPWQPLRLAWLANRQDWKKTYRSVPARNKNYVSHSVPVPTDVLYAAIMQAMAPIIPFNPPAFAVQREDSLCTA